jgi:hypothetical protein
MYKNYEIEFTRDEVSILEREALKNNVIFPEEFKSLYNKDF